MHARRYRTTLAVALMSSCLCAAAPAQEPAAEDVVLPTVKFFYYDAVGVEWIVSAEPDGFEKHLASNAESQDLFAAVSNAVTGPPEPDASSVQMSRWIENERTRFEQSRREPARVRMAEGIVAYLRAHDFSISKLVEALKRRSGADEVQLVVIHLIDSQGRPSFKLKVVLVDPEITIGKQGFNVNLSAPDASYTVVAYALGVALYEVQEIIHGASPGAGAPDSERIEPLPLPEPVEARNPAPVARRPPDAA